MDNPVSEDVLHRIRELLGVSEVCATISEDLDEDEVPTLEVKVPMTEVEDARRRLRESHLAYCFDGMCLSIYPIQPDLIHAQLGDFVLLFNKHALKKDFPIGIVTSIYRNDEGCIHCYGCRYLILKPNYKAPNVSGNNLFEITSEDYGGYHKGFVEVISEKEALSIFNRRAKNGVKKQVKAIRDDFKTLNKDVADAVQSLTSKKYNMEIACSNFLLRPIRP